MLYSAIYVGSCWKIHVRRQIKNTETKYSPEKANNAKYDKIKLASFSLL